MPLVHDWIHFTGITDEEITGFDVPVNEIFYPLSSGFITELTKQTENEFFSSAPHRETLLAIKMTELMIKLGRSIKSPPIVRSNAQTARTLIEVRKKFFSDLGKGGSVEAMAKEAGLSPSRFHAVYKAEFGISPVNDLISARIEAAKNILSRTDDKIESVAISLGYRNVTHFIRQFRKAVGVTPGKYRETETAHSGYNSP